VLSAGACADPGADDPSAPAAATPPAAAPAPATTPPAAAPAPATTPAPSDPSQVAVPREASRRVRLVAVGDLVFGRYHMDKRYRRVSDGDPFGEVAELIGGADLAIGNLECPLAEPPEHLRLTPAVPDRPVDDPGWSLSFRAEPDDAGLLAAAGFTHLSMANNHVLDMGRAAALATRDHLAAAGITGLGFAADAATAARPAVVTIHGVRLALIAWTTWTKGRPAVGDGWAIDLVGNRGLRTGLAAEIARVKAETAADFVVVSLHWGWEWQTEPRTSQRTAAHALIDAGADVIIGHHPHVVQSFERYHGGVIAYSLGNFLFDLGTEEGMHTVVLDLVLDAGGGPRVTARLHPALIAGGTHRPHLARGRAYRSWARRLAARAPGFTIAGEPAEERAGDRAGAGAGARSRSPATALRAVPGRPATP